jgi:hypothetical protein
MDQPATAPVIPGGRIEGYRNSTPRLIRLIGLGDSGAKVVRRVAAHAPANVQVTTNEMPVGWDELASDATAGRSNLIVVVCAERDQRLFCPDRGKPDMLVTFVLLQNDGNLNVAADHRLANARRFADLFVTTSDTDYVSDLIDNLAS